MKKVIALGVLAAAVTNSMAARESSIDIFETKEEALIAAGLDVYISPKNAEVIDNIENNVEGISPDYYGGTWIEYDKDRNAYQVIALTSLSGVNKKTAEIKNVKTVFVKYSLQDLENLRTKIWNLFEGKTYYDESLIFGIARDDVNNKLIVKARDINFKEIQDIISQHSEFKDVISYENQDGPVTLFGNIYGGTKIASYLPNKPNTGGGTLCTAGFNVIIDGIYQGTLTAGHCVHQANEPSWTSVYFNNSTTVTPVSKGAYIGEFLADEFPYGIDAVLFGNVSHVHNTSSKYLGINGVLTTVRGVKAPAINTDVCHYGAVTKWHCGEQKILSSQQIYLGVYYNFSEANFCGAGGDSGGPVVTKDRYAVGLYAGVLGANADPNGTCGASVGGTFKPNSIYQPLGPYLNKYTNVKLQVN